MKLTDGQTYESLLVARRGPLITVTLNRPAQQNSLNAKFFEEFNHLLDGIETDPELKCLVLQGQDGIFCTGMDFEEVAAVEIPPGSKDHGSTQFMDTLRRMALFPKVVVAVVDGRAMAGGIGLVAASDLVIATPRSQFSLSEALWGLLPACVTPYLIRRIGFQRAFRMTLTTLPIGAEEAQAAGLVDEVSDTPDESLRRYLVRLARLRGETIGRMKSYFRKMWLIDQQMEDTAVAEITELVSDRQIRTGIANFVNHQKFPWET